MSKNILFLKYLTGLIAIISYYFHNTYLINLNYGVLNDLDYVINNIIYFTSANCNSSGNSWVLPVDAT